MATTFVLETTEPTERIEAEVCALAGQIAAATCRFVLMIAELDRREAWREWGCRSTAHWLSWKCALGIVAARDHVRVGRSLERLPAIRTAFAEGRLSYSKVRALTRVATEGSEADLLEFALVATASQLERTVRGFERLRSDVETEATRIAMRRLRFFDEPHGMVAIDARIGSDLHDRLNLAIDRALKDVPIVEDDSAESRRVDALAIIVDEFLAGRSERVPTEVVVHVDAEALAPDDVMPFIEELLCDTSVRIDVKRGDEHEVGRRAPTIPRALRRAIARRDRGGCRFPGCPNTRFLHVHHLVHRVREGDTNTTNCVQLCTFHHRLVHRAGWMVFGDGDDEIVFVTPGGKEFHDSSPPVAPQRFRPVPGITAQTIATSLGERLDLDHAVEVLEHRFRFSRN